MKNMSKASIHPLGIIKRFCNQEVLHRLRGLWGTTEFFRKAQNYTQWGILGLRVIWYITFVPVKKKLIYINQRTVNQNV